MKTNIKYFDNNSFEVVISNNITPFLGEDHSFDEKLLHECKEELNCKYIFIENNIVYFCNEIDEAKLVVKRLRKNNKKK